MLLPVTRKRKFRDPDDSKLREDTAETAFRTLQEATGERPKTVPGERPEKNPRAVKRGKKGGKKGGRVRAQNLSEEEKSESARNAARQRWERDT